MKREFLEGLGLEKDAVDRIIDENSKDIGRWKQKAEAAEADKAAVEQQLIDRDKDMEDLRKSAADADGIRKQLEDLQAKYKTDTEQYQAQLSERDYADAVSHAIAASGVKFSSKAAEKAFVADLKTNRLEMKDGALVGFDEYHKAQLEADPTAFQGDKPAPSFVRPIGAGGPPPAVTSRAKEIANKFMQDNYGVKEQG